MPPILLLEASAFEHGHPEGFEVARSHSPALGSGQDLVVLHVLALDTKSAVVAEAGVQGNGPGQPHPRHSRQSLEALVQSVVEGQDLGHVQAAFRGEQIRPVEVDFGVQDVFGAEARLDLPQAGEAAEHEGGADEQDEGQGQLPHHQSAPQAAARAALPGAASLHEGRAQPAPGGKARQRSREDAGEQRHGEGEGEDRGVEPQLGRAGRETGREHRQQAGGTPCETQAQDSPRHREQGAFGDELAQQSAAAGSERGPHGQLLVPPRQARHHQVGHVGAGDEQHTGDGAQEHEEGRPRGAHQLFAQRKQGGPVAGLLRVGLRVGETQTVRHRGHLGGRALQGHAALHPSEGQKHPRLPVLHHRRPRAERAGHRGHEDVVFARVARQGRQDADQGMYAVVHVELAAHHARVGAEMLLPELVACEQHGLGPRHLLVGPKAAPERGLDAENAEEVPRHDARLHPLRLTRAEQREGHRVVLDQPVEALDLGAKVLDLEGRKAEIRDAGPGGGLLEEHQRLPVAIRQGTQQHGVHHGEHGAVGPDAEGEGEHHHRGEAGAAAQAAQAIAHVLHEVLQQTHAAGVAAGLFRSLHGTEVHPRLPAGLPGVEPEAPVLLGLHLEVEAHLVVHLAVALRAVGEGADPGAQPVEQAHHAVSRMRATAADSRVQFAVSSSSRLRPARVSS